MINEEENFLHVVLQHPEIFQASGHSLAEQTIFVGQFLDMVKQIPNICNSPTFYQLSFPGNLDSF